MSENQAPAVGVSLKSICGSGKDGVEMVFQTHFPSSLSAEEMDLLLDKYAKRLERQRLIGEIPEIKEGIARHKKSIKDIEDGIVRIDRQQQLDWEKSGRSGQAKLSAANQKQREESSINLKGWREGLEKLEAKLAEANALLDDNYKKPRAVKSA